MSLVKIPIPPANFTFIQDELQPGQYIVGMDKFTADDIHITNVFQRQINPAEEYILGILSVLLIAMLSDIAHTCMLRTSNRQLNLNSLLSAYMVHELSHFRNIWTHLKPSDHAPAHRALLTRRRAILSLVVLSIALALFCADVIAVLLTQPSARQSRSDEYNLQAVQPIATNDNLSKFIRRLVGDRPCVTPVMADVMQQRDYLINSCVIISEEEELAGDDDVSEQFSIASFFHRGGSDHNITIGSGRIGIQIRAQILRTKDLGGARRLVFESVDDEDHTHAKYIQQRVVYGALEWACREFASPTCAELSAQVRMTTRTERRTLLLWRGKKDDVYTDAEGVITDAKIAIKAPFRALSAGMRALISSAGVMEVTRTADYVRVANDEEEHGLNGLLSETGRVAGLATFGMITGLLLVVMIGLRISLKPVTLGYVAVSGVQREAGVDLITDDFFDGVHDEGVEEYMQGIGANGMGRTSYQGSFHRTEPLDTF